MAVGRGQQDPAKHQLLAAFYTDIRRVGHIYATASRRLQLKRHSALIAWIIPLPPAVLSPPPARRRRPYSTCLFINLCAAEYFRGGGGAVGAAYLLSLLDCGEKKKRPLQDGCFTQLAYSNLSRPADKEQVHSPR